MQIVEHCGYETWGYVELTADTDWAAYIKTAQFLIKDERYYQAIFMCKKFGVPLSEIPEYERKKMLGLVSNGDVHATQNIAKLVKSEEDELLFNEARAGMVL